MKSRQQMISAISLIGAFSLTAMAVILFATRQGVGLTSDSATYIATARNLLSGNGLSSLGSWKAPVPAAVFPPFFPAVLSLLGFLGLDPAAGARTLNTLLFGLNIFLIGWILLRLTASLATAAAGAFFSLTSLCLLQIHSMAWTEPLFLFLMLTALYLLSSHLMSESSHYGLLIGASLAAALGVLTRKAGLALALTGFLGILILGRGKIFRRLLGAILFLSLSILFLGVWSLWKNHADHGIYEVKTLAFHPFLYDFFRQTAFTVSVWMLPESVPQLVRAGFLLIFLAGFFSSAIYVWARDKTRFPVLISLLALFILCHFAIYAGSITFFANQFVDNRALAPVFAAGLILVFFVLDRLWQEGGPFSKALKVSFILLGALLGVSYGARAASWVVQTANQGQGYANLAWRSSPALEKLRMLPEGIPLYTNAPDAVYLLTGKLSSGLPAKYLPRKIHVPSLRENSGYSAEWNEMIRDLNEGRGVLAYFDGIHSRPYYPAKTDLEEALAPIQGEKTRDGILYRF